MKNLEVLSLEDQREISGGKTPDWAVALSIQAFNEIEGVKRIAKAWWDGFKAGS